MDKINNDHNKQLLENKINKNLFRFLVREYLKQLDFFEILDILNNVFISSVAKDIKPYYSFYLSLLQRVYRKVKY